LVDTLCYAPDAARLKSASLGASRRASAYADVLVGAGRPKACGPAGCTGEVHLAPTVSVAGVRFSRQPKV